MKRLLLLLTVLLAVPAAFAQSNGAVVLTSKGTLYTASVKWSDQNPEVNAASATYIALTVREPDAAARELIVPATLAAGANSSPSIAWNEDTDTLYVFWQYMANAMSSELRFTSLDRDGKWTAPSSFENAAYHLRHNLRIALTRKSTVENEEDGTTSTIADVNVHATWWEKTGAGERARYALLSFDEEGAVSLQTHDLNEFVGTKLEKPFEVGEKFNREILRHPAIFEAANGESVDVIFGDVDTNAFHRVKLGVKAQARVRIPVGRGDRVFGAPGDFAAAANGSIDAISPHDDRIVFFFEDKGSIKYLVNRDDSWSSVRSILLNDGVTRDTALGAIRRFVGAH
jgi:hypothetical protein